MDALAIRRIGGNLAAPRRIAPEVERRFLVRILGPHFDRNGFRFCDCCVLDDRLNDYQRMVQLNLDGKIYIVKCDRSHGYTRFDESGNPLCKGVVREMFSVAVLKTAQIFEMDGTNPTKEQRLVEGKEREAIITKILNNEGELSFVSE